MDISKIKTIQSMFVMCEHLNKTMSYGSVFDDREFFVDEHCKLCNIDLFTLISIFRNNFHLLIAGDKSMIQYQA